MRYGTEYTLSLPPKVSKILPDEIKESKTLQVFRAKIEKGTTRLPRGLCRTYLPQVGFISQKKPLDLYTNISVKLKSISFPPSACTIYHDDLYRC